MEPEGEAPEGPEGVNGATLELCRPLNYQGRHTLNDAFVVTFINRIRAAAFREPELLAMFCLTRASVSRVLADVRDLFSKERTLEEVAVPHDGKVHILGDLHGDLFSLLSAINIVGLPNAKNKIVIAGDLVDRGPWGVEILLCVFILKLWKPKCMYVIRGNHETTGCVDRYGFQAEVLRKFDLKTHRAFMSTVRELPLAILVTKPYAQPPKAEDTAGRSSKSKASKAAKRKQPQRSTRSGASARAEPGGTGSESGRRVLVCHGGLWRENPAAEDGDMTIGSLADLAVEHRQVDDPMGTIAEDVLWSDPGQEGEAGVRKNALRGAGILFGAGAVETFLKKEGVDGIIRGHEGPDMRRIRGSMNDMSEGYSIDMEVPGGFLATVFSAADYPMDAGLQNKGAVATIEGRSISDAPGMLPKFTTYESSRPEPVCMFYAPEASISRPCTPR